MLRTTDYWKIVVSGLMVMTIANCSADLGDRTEHLDDMVVPKQLSCSIETEPDQPPVPYWITGAQIVRNDSAAIVVEMTLSSLPPEQYSNLVENPPSFTDVKIYMLDGGSWEDRPLGKNEVHIELERLSRPATASRTVEVESDDPESGFPTDIESEEEWSSPTEIQVSEMGNAVTVTIAPSVFPNLRPGKDFYTEVHVSHLKYRHPIEDSLYGWSRCK